MKPHIDVITVTATHNLELKSKLNNELNENDSIVSVIMTENRWTVKTYIVIIKRNVSEMIVRKKEAPK